MSRSEGDAARALRRLARLHGVQLSYTDVTGRRWRASEASLLGVLRALGEPLRSARDAARLLSRALRRRWDRCLDPVAVAWDGSGGRAVLRLPLHDAKGRWSGVLRLEDGRTVSLAWQLGRIRSAGAATVDGKRYVAKALPLPRSLPLGYHRLQVPRATGRQEALILSAPTKAHEPPPGRRWGVFVPLHALWSSRSWGVGDYSDLASVVRWVGEHGGAVVGTLPLLPTFLGRIVEPSPYSPASRLFWGEVFLDVAQAAGAGRDAAIGSELDALRASPLVDYARVAAVKKRALAASPEDASEPGGDGTADLDAYAAFRAATEAWGGWPGWPGRTAKRTPPLPAFDSREATAHRRAQVVAQRQVEAASHAAADRCMDLYLDLPIGVHPEGFDTWRHPEAFVRGVSVGAPPDSVFTSGQEWGFPPPHPDGLRETGYGYLVAVLRRQMRVASMLRLDHVMGLHRLFWIPDGLPATEGVYVHYAADELYAIVILESTRNRCAVVGENLGTVPAYVNQSMRRHGIRPLYVLQYETEGPAPGLPPPVPAGAVASVNTHDMPPFAAYWSGADIDVRAAAGLFPKDKVAAEHERRAAIRDRVVRTLTRDGWLRGPPTPPVVFDAVLDFLGASDAWAVLVNLEDLWGETEFQNLPGTGAERPNWRRRLRLSLEEIERDSRVASALKRLDVIRKGQITYPNPAR
ncbi:MAG TPA: 4-alpha-glucanotransferase [Thermoplasmata archaeon]|nr:4-alpha-glucanotransferase [Thermoplasmata archaeon]